MVDASDASEELERALEALDPLERTMLIPLRARAAEHERADPILPDPAAAAAARRLPGGVRAEDRGAWKTQVGVAVRSRWLDARVRDYRRRVPDGTVVIAGAGCCTRPRRLELDGRRVRLLDTPAALRARAAILDESADDPRHLAGSVLDPAWIDALPAGPPPLLVAEGVLMFLPRAEVAALLGTLAARHPGAEVACDLIGTLMVRVPRLHDSLPAHRVRFAWGEDRPQDPDAWPPSVAPLAVRPMIEESPRRWRWMRHLRHWSWMRRQFTGVHLRCGGPPGPLS